MDDIWTELTFSGIRVSESQGRLSYGGYNLRVSSKENLPFFTQMRGKGLRIPWEVSESELQRRTGWKGGRRTWGGSVPASPTTPLLTPCI